MNKSSFPRRHSTWHNRSRCGRVKLSWHFGNCKPIGNRRWEIIDWQVDQPRKIGPPIHVPNYSTWDRYSCHAWLIRGFKYKILLANKTCCFLPSVTNTTTPQHFFFQHEFILSRISWWFKEFINHSIFGNFILLNLLTLGFKLQNWRKGPLWLTKLSSPHNTWWFSSIWISYK